MMLGGTMRLKGIRLCVARITVYVIYSVIFCSMPIAAMTIGQDAMNVSYFGHSVKSSALGNAQTAGSSLSAYHSNPASLASVSRSELQFQYVSSVESINYKNMKGVVPTRWGNMGIHWGWLDMGTQQRRLISDKQGRGTASFSNSAQQLGLSISRVINQWSLGTTLTRHSMRLDTFSSSAWSLSAGVKTQPVPHWTFGVALNNLTLSKAKFQSDSAALAHQFRMGAHTKTQLFQKPAQIMFDYVKQATQSGYFNVGIDSQFTDILSLRAGYSGYSDWGQLRCGLGLQFSTFYVDMSYQPVDFFSDSFRFGFGIPISIIQP